MEETDIQRQVREHYGAIAEKGGSCCGSSSSCCGNDDAEQIGKAIGYNDNELSDIPDGANLGLGCGNPTAIASIKPGETVLDLGSGAGFDCFLAAKKTGDSGKVIGVDMTHEMLSKARENSTKGGYRNVEFRLGEIEHLPVADNSVDLIISNCVINLSVDKAQVFKEANRVLSPGGRMMISDIVLLRELPEKIRKSVDAYAGCIAGALLKEEYLGLIAEAGFDQVEVKGEKTFGTDLVVDNPDLKQAKIESGISDRQVDETADSIVSMMVSARKKG